MTRSTEMAHFRAPLSERSDASPPHYVMIPP